MGLSVRKLNGDTTFLLSFSDHDDSGRQFRVLIDPWLRGQVSWLHPSFQSSERTIEPVIDSLERIAGHIDLLIISQDKPDHCHKETLCSWPISIPVRILATPAAARKIRGWKHYPADWIHELRTYNEADSSTLCRIVVPGSRGTPAGELTIANLTTKKDLTGLHNAIGFTFEPLTRRDSRIEMAEPHTARSETSSNSEKKSLRYRIKSYRSLRHAAQQQPTLASTPPQEGRCLSCIYSPHGIPASLLEPYVRNHLRSSGALPVTVFIHSIVMERNPWYMGGIVAAGTPGGIELIKTLDGQVKAWISAHDEPKDNRGLSVKLLKTERFGEDRVKDLLHELGYQHIKLSIPEPGQEVYLAG